ncbi:sensor histidine kinase [Phenylobacterium sp.]|uniref:sensor histidine kinase n=1 Tax=Phenylobacterium sp. TaxID=1871053 RepID=UPI002DE2F22D|nr:sensor histidine kinase [Phenylobacterium sp.]
METSGFQIGEPVAAPISSKKEDAALSLTLAVVTASHGPLLLLDRSLNILAASRSFCSAFDLDRACHLEGSVFALGQGEWNVPQLRTLLTATAEGDPPIEAYEFDLKRPGVENRRLAVNAQLLSYLDLDQRRILVAVADVTDARASEKARDKLRSDNELLLKEVRHRVANSLQIVASVLLQGARRAQSEEARGHLRDAHHRVMSVATLERQLSPTASDDMPIGVYLTKLCASIGDSMIPEVGRIVLTVEADDALVAANRSVSLGLITTELVINSLRHGFPSGQAGKITVTYRTQSEAWTLEVADTGVGMGPQSAPAHAGLGTSIVQALARQLEATVETHDARPGLRVAVSHRVVAGSAAEPAVAAV